MGRSASCRKQLRKPGRWVGPAVWLALVLGPLLLLALVELALRGLGYGVSGNPVAETSWAGRYTLNTAYHTRFHPRTGVPPEAEGSQHLPFLIQIPKPPGVYRIVVLGGSTAQGYPFFSGHAFADVAASRMNEHLEEWDVELVNLAHSAMSSYYVRDTARRLARLEPDMILVYSGHNEYYGTIGAGSGPGHRRKLLGLGLKSSRLAQALFNALAPPLTEAGTLMDELSAGRRFPADPELDDITAARFVDNMDVVRLQAGKLGAALVVVEPVSNLIDMPPFASADSEELAARIAEGRLALLDGGGSLEEWAAKDKSKGGARDNAHLLFLRAVAKAQEGETDLDAFRAAKEADAMPFRAREALRSALAGWAAEHAGEIYYVPLEEELIAAEGAGVLGDGVFIDHVHFSLSGQQLVGRILAGHLLRAGPGGEGADASFAGGVGGPGAMASGHPVFEVHALLDIQRLLQNPPFRGMKIPYSGHAASEALSRNRLMNNPQVAELIQGRHRIGVIQSVTDLMVGREAWHEVSSILKDWIRVSPGNPVTHLDLASFLDWRNVADRRVLDLYFHGFMLSYQDSEILHSMRFYAERHGFDEHLERLLSGDPD